MTVIFLHVQFLLRNHDCVIVPGWGAFIASSMPARIDLENGKIYPPTRCVSFNQALRDDDGLLVNSLARKNRLTFDEARMALVRQVAEMRQQLENNGDLPCGALGTLHMQEEGNLLFSGPETNPSEAMGFNPVVLFKGNPQTQGEPQKIEPEMSLALPRRRKMPVVRVAVMLALLFTIAAALILFPIPQDSREHRASVVPVEALLGKHAAAPEEAPAREPEQPSALPTPEAVAEEQRAEMPSHYLIVGTFSSKAEAERFISLKASEAFPMEAVESSKLTRVSIASSSDRRELRQKLNSHEIASRFPNAWIWSRP